MDNKNLFNKILDKIKEYNKIIILRHKLPDYDAYGSQLGLYFALKENFKNKEIYVAGDENINNLSNKKMDDVTINTYKGSLVIIVDTAHDNMMNDNLYQNADYIIVMDHHNVEYTVGDLSIVRSDYSSASELVCEFCYYSNFKITKEAADMFFIGICGDSNRFLYKGTTSNTFRIVAKLVDDKADIINDYKIMMKEEKDTEKRIKGYILSNFIIKENVAYIYVSRSIIDELNVDENYVSRGCINLLSGIIGVDAFLGFTEYKSGEINVELRSKNKSVVNVAKRNGGGGHDLACGLRIKCIDDTIRIVDEVIEELKK